MHHRYRFISFNSLGKSFKFFNRTAAIGHLFGFKVYFPVAFVGASAEAHYIKINILFFNMVFGYNNAAVNFAVF